MDSARRWATRLRARYQWTAIPTDDDLCNALRSEGITVSSDTLGHGVQAICLRDHLALYWDLSPGTRRWIMATALAMRGCGIQAQVWAKGRTYTRPAERCAELRAWWLIFSDVLAVEWCSHIPTEDELVQWGRVPREVAARYLGMLIDDERDIRVG